MAVCSVCEREKTDGQSCNSLSPFRIEGVVYNRVPFGREGNIMAFAADYCPDCRTPVGGYHHPGCDREQCPRCAYQALSCGCPWDDWDGTPELSRQAVITEHRCTPPPVVTLTGPRYPPWTCGICERVWFFQWNLTGYGHWVEIRGPAPTKTS